MYVARRTRLNNYIICTRAGREVATTTFTDQLAVWPTENAPMSGAVRKSGREAFPELAIKGVKYLARRRLLSSHFLLDDFCVWLEHGETRAIEATIKGASRTIPIERDGQTWLLRRESLLGFRYSLSREDGGKLAQFSESTPFLQFSVKRQFDLDVQGTLDELLLTFAFWLAVNRTYR